MLVSVNCQLCEIWASGHAGRIVLIVLIKMGDLPTVRGASFLKQGILDCVKGGK